MARSRCWRPPRSVADVPVYLDGVGTTRALNTVTVRPQVDGKLMQHRCSRKARTSSAATCWREIDPTTYQAQLDQAMAKKAQDEAQLANARLDLERYTRLAATNSVDAPAGRHPEGAGRAARGAGASSTRRRSTTPRPILDYTTITAPIDGRTGIRLVDEGNIVRAVGRRPASSCITQIQPISVLFTLPQQQLGAGQPRLRRRAAARSRRSAPTTRR